ncbi:MAG: type II toxin-antitoxin system antitoxin, RelB/DinJ family [Kiritimatiellae bacterium]|nr:type II toxin-antitoxin system antitoxin, RelB/DinJ family [Kiritimatiellia bacterium]
MDDTLRNDADSLFSDLGMDIPSAVRIFLRQAVIRRELPFRVVSSDSFYSETNMAHVRRNIDELESGRGVVHELVETP